MERRLFLSATTSAAVATIAGCLGSDDDDSPDDGGDDADGEEDGGAANGDADGEDTEEDEDAETAEGGPDPDEVPTVSESELNDNIDYNEFEQHLREAPNWSENREIHDFRGYDEVTIMVGADFDGEMVFDPVAVNIDPGTTVKWEWTGNSEESIYTGSRPDFSTSPYEEAGIHQEQEFTEDDVGLYPFSSFQTGHMKGALLVDGLE